MSARGGTHPAEAGEGRRANPPDTGQPVAAVYPRGRRQVRVDWIDANSKHEQHDADDLPLILGMHTYGLLMVNDDERVVVASEVLDPEPGGDENYRCSTAVPQSWVVRIVDLQEEGA